MDLERVADIVRAFADSAEHPSTPVVPPFLVLGPPDQVGNAVLVFGDREHQERTFGDPRQPLAER